MFFTQIKIYLVAEVLSVADSVFFNLHAEAVNPPSVHKKDELVFSADSNYCRQFE